MSKESNWIYFDSGGKPSVADMLPRLLEVFPSFRSRWEEHLAYWRGKPAGSYNDMSEFVHFVVEDLYPSGETELVRRVFELMEEWLTTGDSKVQDIVVLGFFETLQNVSSWQSFGSEPFKAYLGPQSRAAWLNLEQVWAGKESLMDVIREERKKDN